MEKKYYTPEVEEFFVGFEYEYFIMDNWQPVGYHPSDMAEAERFLNTLHSGKIRVKYLDRKDIESLGFIVKEEETKPYGYYLTATIKHDNYTTTLTYSFLRGKEEIYIHLSNSHYSGNGHYYIKNKLELSKLMKQLKIMK